MQKTLNRNKPFSEVLGHDTYKYGQKGEYFDARGRNVKLAKEDEEKTVEVAQQVREMQEEAVDAGLMEAPTLSMASFSGAGDGPATENRVAAAAEELAV